MRGLKVTLGLISLGWWWLSLPVLSASSDMKIFSYKLAPSTVTFIFLLLVLSFVVLSFLKFRILSTIAVNAFAFLSVYSLFSFGLPLGESIEHLGLVFISFVCLFFSVVDCENNYIYESIITDTLDKERYRTSNCDLHYLSVHNKNLFLNTIEEQDSSHVFDDTLASQINPATGLLCVGGIDSMGNPYGHDLSSHVESYSDHLCDTHSPTWGDISSSISSFESSSDHFGNTHSSTYSDTSSSITSFDTHH